MPDLGAHWILEPKRWFRDQKAIAEAWNTTAESEATRAALQMAFAEMSYRQQAPDAMQRSHNASKLEGAKEYISILLNLGRPERPVLGESQIMPQLKR